MTATGVRLGAGDRAPTFRLPDDTGATVSLADFTGRRLLLYCYPAALTPGCTKQACDFRDRLAELRRAGVEVVGLSPDRPDRLARFRAEQALTFPLLSDPERVTLGAYGAYGPKLLYGKTVLGVIRSTFLISPSATIESAWYNVKATGHVARLHRELGLA